ncbi:Protein-S-isoprenylcysteine O-methyltransferase Ste14 [Eubacterium ruminantium]|uniref:Protein-S-isoprenylcysteine O-methyltransferase Ste14 n=2 Tax=Eubacteriaceae TaxID=186806 RepID=A0A1T4MZA7_9FIRM|nr:Protein-S-isoprenylcysteine O-methyltransferase Ste14 [Eubacterium ruminantium]SDM68747.1 Protein-S-isoprenylcysteine O-methyltransferase Ste14 [Eubacterium ruminantium]SJZ72186.1 Protein-S-isoprenylcysteine O-methyltransferase Ste14 [Eubacterium ruminantium]
MHTYRRVRDAQNRTGVYLKGNGETMSEEIKSSISDRFKSVMEEDEKYGDYDDDLEQELEDEFRHRVVKTETTPLPVYGVGPVFGAIAFVATVLGVVFGQSKALKHGISDFFRIPYLCVGVLLIIGAVFMWSKAYVDVNISDYIRKGNLATTGIYSLTRNPIYAAILFISTGVIFISGNVFMYAIPIFLWGILTVLLQNTEEVLLEQRFGKEYLNYKARVNRILPMKKA